MIFVVLYLESDLSIEIDKFNRKCCLIWFSSVSQPAKFLSQSGIWSGSEEFCPVVLSEKISLRVNCTLQEVLPLYKHTTYCGVHQTYHGRKLKNIAEIWIVYQFLTGCDGYHLCAGWRGGGRPSVSAVVRTEQSVTSFWHNHYTITPYLYQLPTTNKADCLTEASEQEIFIFGS